MWWTKETLTVGVALSKFPFYACPLLYLLMAKCTSNTGHSDYLGTPKANQVRVSLKRFQSKRLHRLQIQFPGVKCWLLPLKPLNGLGPRGLKALRLPSASARLQRSNPIFVCETSALQSWYMQLSASSWQCCYFSKLLFGVVQG